MLKTQLLSGCSGRTSDCTVTHEFSLQWNNVLPILSDLDRLNMLCLILFLFPLLFLFIFVMDFYFNFSFFPAGIINLFAPQSPNFLFYFAFLAVLYFAVVLQIPHRKKSHFYLSPYRVFYFITDFFLISFGSEKKQLYILPPHYLYIYPLYKLCMEVWTVDLLFLCITF